MEVRKPPEEPGPPEDPGNQPEDPGGGAPENPGNKPDDRGAAPTQPRTPSGRLPRFVEDRKISARESGLEATPLEFDLLACLIRNRGRAVSRQMLLAEVWGFPEPDRVRTRTIDTHIATLRSKIESDPARPEFILTVRKIGYRLVPDRPRSEATKRATS